ncbi:MAG: PrgI family protein [Candidatus Andersenbacteria bacterium]|nr:PrgI family protein [Candidatus Andersenbacteria bacterium]
MRYQVPQFVDIEDKIIGPFTLKQFLMYVAAVMVLVPVYLSSDLSLFITIALPVFAIAAAFAHVKIANRSLAITVYNFFIFVSGGQMWVWRRTAKPKKLIIKDKNWQAAQEINTDSKLTPLAFKAQALETEGNTVKAEEVEDPFIQTK